MKTLGARIAHYRRAAGLSQAELAKECGWKSQSRIGNYEKDTREPTLADLEKIAAALGMSVSQLAYGEHVKIPQSAQAAEIARIAQAAPSTRPPEPADISPITPPVKPGLNMAALQKLKGKVTPRSLAAIERIERAAMQGLLKEADLVLLEGIAARFEELNTKQP